ncbi:MAG: DUF2065 domain-containing protein [Deltaproteobacteria bacterium]|nr:DUF2065 domain-containing protein [Deltaproteobacteria bacterium]
MKYFLCVIGMVFVVEGLPYMTFPERIKQYLLKLAAVSDAHLRIMGALAVVIGLALVYFGTQ